MDSTVVGLRETSRAPTYGAAVYVVTLFAVTNALSYADRAMITLLVQPIKHDFGFSDEQIGLLTGLAFGSAYAIFSLPVGWLADRAPRNLVAAAGALIWTVATAACGLATSFTALLLCRVAVGTGEAVVYPTAMTVAADFAPKGRTAHAIGAVITGGFIGTGLALLGGGAILRAIGDQGTLATPFGPTAAWRIAFLVAAAPGLIVSPLLALTVRAPRRPTPAYRPGQGPGQGAWVFFLAHRRLIASLIIGMGFCNLFSSGQGAWMPTLVIRTYHWTAGSVGLAFGVSSIVSGCVGPLLAAHVAARLAARGRQDALILTAIGCVVIAFPCAVAAPLAPHALLAIGLQLVSSMLLYGPYTMAAAAIQSVVPHDMRGRFTALYLFVINMVGLGFGPLIIGFITDGVFHDEAKLRYAVSAWALFALPVGIFFLARVLRPMRALPARAQETEPLLGAEI